METIKKVYSITISTDKGTFTIVPEGDVSIEMNSECLSSASSNKKIFTMQHTFDIKGQFQQSLFIQ